MTALPEGCLCPGPTMTCTTCPIHGDEEELEVTEIPFDLKQAGDPRRPDANWTLLPPPPDVCSQCALDHDPDLPHNQQSLYYQYAFRAEHGRWPTWNDALAHCAPEMQDDWRRLLREKGVDV